MKGLVFGDVLKLGNFASVKRHLHITGLQISA
jgi:hypothetical protein